MSRNYANENKLRYALGSVIIIQVKSDWKKVLLVWRAVTEYVTRHCSVCLRNREGLKELRHRWCILKKMAQLCENHHFQSVSIFAILVPFCSRITPLVFSSLENQFFYVSQHFNRNLGRQRNDKKYRGVAPPKPTADRRLSFGVLENLNKVNNTQYTVTRVAKSF